ncbi:outer membrane beta-barrel protein [Lentiprolixibacter aurantiacus]|uniref:Outer membrane beta-barrel protein n=1 Tax=Lentiprolixibacter aurantiacus TaxID=2993939 RepID=A0AAE3SMI0_9FLAO|nr:outer membrane beta-barrel protein [Lentiprolixibacter aurantiacus]MCX2718604.1 outer membrane beta-barrel protein [Lentiprolixibacter aurantiacus]
MKKFNIDQAYKDRLKDYRETPDERVWESIAASLDQKKSKKRVIPIWWKLGGMAAALALLLYLLVPGGTEAIPEQITDIEEQQEVIEDPAATDSNELIKTIKEQEELAGPDIKEGPDTVPEETITPMEKASENNFHKRQETVIAATTKKNNKKRGEQDNLYRAVIDKNLTAEQNKEQDTGIADNKLTPDNTIEVDAADADKKIVTEVIAEVSEEEQKLPEDNAGKKSIFEALEDQEEEVLAENNSNRWSIGPMVAPVYFNTLGEGSPIHSNFVSNNKSGNVNMSYGVSVSYQVSKKLSLRSGVHRVDYGYDTDEVQFSSSLTASTSGLIDNIDYNTNSRTLVVESQTSRALSQNDAAEVNAQNPAREGRMVQDFGYLEVPVELQYNLVDRKLGVNLIGGVSSLFLTENSVTLQSNNTSTSMGEANNINQVNFSTNFGLGMYYRLSPKMQLNLEPMFKYQLNTFSDTAGNFQPFSIGVYSGLNFRF